MMSSPSVRGALTGGVVGVILHLIVRFILGNLLWIALAVMLLWVLTKCSPENPKEVTQRAILNSFDPSSVQVLDARGITPSYSTYVEAISATVQNGGRARIFDIWLVCSFKPLLLSDPSKPEPQWDVARVRTNYYLGYILPGMAVSIRLIPEPDGYLKEADPNSFNCEPRFEIEKADLLKEQS